MITRQKEPYQVPSNIKFMYQKENKIINALEYLFPEYKIDALISLSCFDDALLEHVQKIKDPRVVEILERDRKSQLSNYKKMLLSCHFKQIKQYLTRMDEYIWNLLERLLQCKIEIIEKNLLPSRKDLPTFKYSIENDYQSEKKIFLLHDPTTLEYYPVTSLC